LGTIWHSLLNIISALILSFIFIVDRKKMSAYLFKIKESNFWFLYSEYKILFDKIIKSFWLILKAQSMVAFANATITIIWLLIVGFVFSTPDVPTFPYILTLWLIVFIFGFVPVLGVILSSIPIMVIWYITYWDFMIIPIIVLLITIVHIIEAYYLNPKIVSSFLKLPMSLTFVILLVSWKMLWIAGLLIGISIFYFSMWLLKDFDSMIWKNKKKIEKNKIFTKGKKTIK
jgi:predicted PurR-regulated permease PerM